MTETRSGCEAEETTAEEASSTDESDPDLIDGQRRKSARSWGNVA